MICSTAHASVAVLQDGTVVAWGNNKHGGISSSVSSLEKSLANDFFDKWSTLRVYDYDTITNNISNDSAEYRGFIWESACWKWVTSYACFSTSLSEFPRVSERALYLI